MSKSEPQALTPAPANVVGAGVITPKKRRRRYSLLTRRDKILLGVMVGVPLFIFLVLIWGMAIVSVVLSFTDWQGLGPLHWVGLQNYTYLIGSYPPFWPALSHNLLWLLCFICFATPMGILLAVCLDRPLRAAGLYQTIFYTPVVLSLAIVGLIWQLQYSQDNGMIRFDPAAVSAGEREPRRTGSVIRASTCGRRSLPRAGGMWVTSWCCIWPG
jgi:multiple sugar transport system permease protein